MKPVSALLALVALSFCPASVRAFTAADADAIFDAHTKAFYHLEGDRAWHTKNTEEGVADFWTRAEQMEMVLDAYERTYDPQRLAMFGQLFRGFVADHTGEWSKNKYNDDIMWMVIACARAYELSGAPEYLEAARKNFDLCYVRAASPDLGGGLFWKVDNRSKNACVNGPGAIAAYLVGVATGEPDYFAKSKDIYLWEKATLFDSETGRVADNISMNGRVSRFALTYNQGTFVGAANLLGYVDDARLAATFTKERLCRDGFLPGSGEDGDGGGFNGIAARWISRFMKDRGEQAAFEPWLQKNADAAWHARRASDNLVWCHWPEPTPESKRYSWGCSSAVVLLQVAPPPAVPPSPEPAHDAKE